MTPRAVLRASVAAFALDIACADSSSPGSPPTVTVSPDAQWSGGTVTLRSDFFIGRNTLPQIIADAATLTPIRADDSTVTFTLPRGPSGRVILGLAHDGRLDSIGSVERIGFREKRSLIPALAGELLVADSADHPMVIGNTDGGVQYVPLGRIDLVTGVGKTFTSVLGPSNVQYGLSPSTPDGTFAVRDSTDSVRLAHLLVTPPVVVGNVPYVGTDFVRQVAQLSPGIWLFTSAHTSTIRAEADPCCTPRFAIPTESPWAVFLSPRGDRSTLATDRALGGHVPVFDNLAGDTAFTLPLQSTSGIAFAPDGARLYAVGGYFSGDTLVDVDATTGQILTPRVALPDGFQSFSIAYCGAGGGRILAAATNDSSVLALLVYDAGTLTLQGVLTTPDDCGTNPFIGQCSYGVVAVDEVRGVAYIVTPGSPTPVWTFDLLP